MIIFDEKDSHGEVITWILVQKVKNICKKNFGIQCQNLFIYSANINVEYLYYLLYFNIVGYNFIVANLFILGIVWNWVGQFLKTVKKYINKYTYFDKVFLSPRNRQDDIKLGDITKSHVFMCSCVQ